LQNDLSKIKKELDAITKSIVENIPVEEIYLFGSFAYGMPEKDSDIDLYLVFKDDMQIREYEALAAARKAMFGIQNRSIDLLGQKNKSSSTVQQDLQPSKKKFSEMGSSSMDRMAEVKEWFDIAAGDLRKKLSEDNTA
jgi:predicted nucleotidyltransferase